MKTKQYLFKGFYFSKIGVQRMFKLYEVIDYVNGIVKFKLIEIK